MMRRHVISFKHAFDGLKTAFTTQPNFRVHLVATLCVLLAGYLLAVSTTEWIVLAFAITLVVVTELINTSIEAVVDLLTEQHNRFAKIAKDVGAAAVLLAAIGAVIIGLIIFLPKLI